MRRSCRCERDTHRKTERERETERQDKIIHIQSKITLEEKNTKRAKTNNTKKKII